MRQSSTACQRHHHRSTHLVTTTATTHVVVVVIVVGTVTAPAHAHAWGGFGAFERLVDGDERGHRAHAAVVAVGAGADLAAEPGAERRESEAGES